MHCLRAVFDILLLFYSLIKNTVVPGWHAWGIDFGELLYKGVKSWVGCRPGSRSFKQRPSVTLKISRTFMTVAVMQLST